LAILTYFKILPTDPRYQNLNLIQKIILLSAIDKDLFDKFEIAKGFIDHIKFYINPEIYKAEKGWESPEESGQQQNTLFEEHSRMGRKYGVIHSPKRMKDAISEFYGSQKKETKKKEEIIFINDNEEDTLG
jgi:hypothetical protein